MLFVQVNSHLGTKVFLTAEEMGKRLRGMGFPEKQTTDALRTMVEGEYFDTAHTWNRTYRPHLDAGLAMAAGGRA